MDLITIGITTYNASDTVASAVDSALKQTYPNIEVVIVDDCSSDDTYNILEKLAVGCSKIKIIRHQKNLGVAVARNTIINNASGKYIAFFDDDDESDVTRLQKQYERLTEYTESSFSVCYTAREQASTDGSVFYIPTAACNLSLPMPRGKAMACRILAGTPLKNGNGAMATCSQMALKETYLKVGGFDEAFRRSEDTDFNIRLALMGGHFLGVKQPLVQQKLTMSDEKAVTEEKRFFMKLFEKHNNFLNEEGVPVDFLKRWTSLKYDWIAGHDKRRLITAVFCLFCRFPCLTLKKIWWSIPSYKENSEQKRFYKFHDEK